MNRINSLSIIIVLFGLFGCNSTPPSTTVATAGSSTPTTAQKIESFALTAANVIQTLNTGLMTVAPTVETLLQATGNANDASLVAGVDNKDALITPVLSALVAQVQTAVAASLAAGSTPAQQRAAVSAAVSPASVANLVAPIAAASN